MRLDLNMAGAATFSKSIFKVHTNMKILSSSVHRYIHLKLSISSLKHKRINWRMFIMMLRLQCVCGLCALRMMCRSSTDSLCFHTGSICSPLRIHGWLPQTQHLSITFTHLADAFIHSDLQCIQAIHLYCQYVFPGNRTHNLCTANAML